MQCIPLGSSIGLLVMGCHHVMADACFDELQPSSNALDSRSVHSLVLCCKRTTMQHLHACLCKTHPAKLPVRSWPSSPRAFLVCCCTKQGCCATYLQDCSRLTFSRQSNHLARPFPKSGSLQKARNRAAIACCDRSRSFALQSKFAYTVWIFGLLLPLPCVHLARRTLHAGHTMRLRWARW